MQPLLTIEGTALQPRAELYAGGALARSAGVRLVDEIPRAGAHETRVAFLHPKSLGGVLFELTERSDPPK